MKVWFPAGDVLVSGTRVQPLSVIGQQPKHTSISTGDRQGDADWFNCKKTVRIGLPVKKRKMALSGVKKKKWCSHHVTDETVSQAPPTAETF